ncbi:MAG: N-acetylmuramoyl-L-alanine amidase [Planctomycetia bacterium]|nr:N-acetylmuramoyl-L-alanine amidase [Planctomycetia bacterium]
MSDRASLNQTICSCIRWDQSPNFSGRYDQPVDILVLHATGCGAVNGAMKRFKNRRSEASAHFVILRNGVVLQLVELDQAAWHTSTKSTGVPNQALCEITAKLHGAKGRVAIPGFYDNVRTWSCEKTAQERVYMASVVHCSISGKYFRWL